MTNTTNNYRFPVIMFPMTVAVVLARYLLQVRDDFSMLDGGKLIFLKILTFFILFLGIITFMICYHSAQTFFFDGLLNKILLAFLGALFYFFGGYDRFPTRNLH